MTYHKWDTEYYEKQLRIANDDNMKLRLQVADLQKKLSALKKQITVFTDRPVLFIEQGSMLEPLQQIELNFQFRVVWLKRGAVAPIIYEPKRPA